MFPMFMFSPSFRWGDLRFPLSGEVEQRWDVAMAADSPLTSAEIRRQVILALMFREEWLRRGHKDEALRKVLAGSSWAYVQGDDEARQKDLDATTRLLASLF